jgi:hypothetical protein
MAHYNYIRVKRNWRLISPRFVITFHLILSSIISWYPYRTIGLDAIPRHSANCFTKTDHSSSSLVSYSRFNDKNCYHGYHAHWTPIEWSWTTEMRRLTLQGTWTFHVTQRSRWRRNSQALGQLFRQDISLISSQRSWWINE